MSHRYYIESSFMYLDAIVIDWVNGAAVGRKYHNINCSAATLRRFCLFVRMKFPNARYINFYNAKLPKGKNYVFRYYMSTFYVVTL